MAERADERKNGFLFCGDEGFHEGHEVQREARTYWCPGNDASAETSVLAWWASNYWRQIARLHEAYRALGIDEPVNFTGEVRNRKADALLAELDAHREASGGGSDG